VALPTSELATAMPESGGGYFFVSRALGTLFGCMVGLGQWLGLVFASAFYLMGFGHYLSDLFHEIGIELPLSVMGLALGMAILLTGISITGTENTGDLQNWIVGSLLAILGGFLGHGGLDVLGVFGHPQMPAAFFPYGTLPVFTTAALVFTSYLGFVQIATVAGEIKDPSRNLPLSMIGSVLLVGTLYILTIFVGTSLLGSEQLATLGETAVVNVGRSIAGTLGAGALIGGGLLATLSSANASILSASRSIYALSRDDLVPSRVGRINRRYRTPHVALLLAGGPIVGLILFGRVEVLAEVASLLHLFMYGLICVALLVLRRSPPDGYEPSFRCPGYPVVPLLGALASFGLVGFMNPLSIGLGGGLLLATAGWYLYYARTVTISEISS